MFRIAEIRAALRDLATCELGPGGFEETQACQSAPRKALWNQQVYEQRKDSDSDQ
jgi:hypothetical protein